MYNRHMFKIAKSIILDQVASTAGSTSGFTAITSTQLCNINGWTTRKIGQNFEWLLLH